VSDHSYFCKKCREFTFIKYVENEMAVLKCSKCDKPMKQDFDEKNFKKEVDLLLKNIYINAYNKEIQK
jgi:hypothetical protein